MVDCVCDGGLTRRTSRDGWVDGTGFHPTTSLQPYKHTAAQATAPILRARCIDRNTPGSLIALIPGCFMTKQRGPVACFPMRAIFTRSDSRARGGVRFRGVPLSVARLGLQPQYHVYYTVSMIRSSTIGDTSLASPILRPTASIGLLSCTSGLATLDGATLSISGLGISGTSSAALLITFFFFFFLVAGFFTGGAGESASTDKGAYALILRTCWPGIAHVGSGVAPSSEALLLR